MTHVQCVGRVWTEKTAAVSPRQSPPPSPWTPAHRRDGPSETPTCLIPRFSSPTSNNTPRRQNASHSPLFISVAVIIISVWYFFVFLFSILMPFSSTMYTDIRTDVLTVTWGLLDLSFFFFFCLITYQPRLIMIKPMSSLLPPLNQTPFPSFLKCTAAIHYCGEMPDFISHTMPSSRKIS